MEEIISEPLIVKSHDIALDAEKLQRLVGELQASINQERIKLQQPVGEVVTRSYDALLQKEDVEILIDGFKNELTEWI